MKDRFDIDRTGHDYVVALAGNPNTGKSTLFNGFTGLRQHTGNWPGKTVTRAEGTLRYEDKRYKLVDLPGAYSLIADGQDEQVARDFVLFGKPDCVVIVLDATNVERNLALALQILEVTGRVVIALNLIDEAQRRGITVDAEKISQELKVPVVPTVARDKKGLIELAAAIADVCSGKAVAPSRRRELDPELESAVTELERLVEAVVPGVPNARWIALRLLDGDPSIEEGLASGEFATPATPTREGSGKPSEVAS
ncbi:MAG: FeoB small GTPase domain-containing protein [Fimbriimonadales bacterium]